MNRYRTVPDDSWAVLERAVLRHQHLHVQGVQKYRLTVRALKQRKDFNCIKIQLSRYCMYLRHQCCGSGSGRIRNYLQNPDSDMELLISDPDPGQDSTLQLHKAKEETLLHRPLGTLLSSKEPVLFLKTCREPQ